MKEKKPILVLGGASGGHLFPALALVEELEVRGEETLLGVPQKAQHVIKSLGKSERTYIQMHEIKRSFNPMQWVLPWYKAYEFLSYFKPRMVIGFGSNISICFIIVARCMKILTLIHEQNVSFGKANNLLRFIARYVAISFPLEMKGSKYILSGNPLRRCVLKECRQDRDTQPKRKERILVLGGSQGASFLNRIVPRALRGMDASIRSSLHIDHMSGHFSQQGEIEEEYQRMGVSAHVFQFTNSIADYMKDADCIIARAGAGTIFELIYFQKAAILIPYPYARGHQMENALFCTQNGAAELIEQKKCSPTVLAKKIEKVLKEPLHYKKNLGTLKRKMPFDAQKMLADIICQNHDDAF